MGDRAIIHLHSPKSQAISPGLYLHWGGSEAPILIQEWWTYMGERRGVIEYGFARLVGLAHVQSAPSPLSLGVFPLDAQKQDYASNVAQAISEAQSPGDNGIWLIDIDTGLAINHHGDHEGFLLE